MDFVPVIRAFRPVFWFFLGVAIVAVPMLSFATNMPVMLPGVNVVLDPVTGNQYTYGSPGGKLQSIQYSPTSTVNGSIRVPTSAGSPNLKPVSVPVRLPVNAAKVASISLGILKAGGPVGVGLLLLPIVCEYTQICAGPAGTLQISKPGDYWKDTVHFGAQQFASVQEICDARSPSAGVALYVEGDMCLGVPPPHYLYATGTLYHDGPATTAPLADSDLPAAIAALTASTVALNGLVQQLQNGGQAIPLNDPQSDEKTDVSPAVSTVQRDQAGNITNTMTTTTTTIIGPVTNSTSGPVSNVTQITNNTTTDTSTGVTVSSSTTADPLPPDDPEIEFDTVDDVPLKEQELPLNMAAPSSWGEGSCPPDPSVSVMGYPIAVPVHVVCDYMVGVRGAVIALFALISAYIVIGVKFEG